MTLKHLATGMAAAAIIGGVAAGVTSVAFATPMASPAVQPVVFGAPLPQTPAPELQSALVATLDGLQGGGSFSGSKAAFIQGGLGRIEGITADRAFSNASAKGYFPLSFTVADIDQQGPTATANVTATASQRRRREPEHPVHRRPEPHRLAADEVVSAVADVLGRLSRRWMPRNPFSVLSAATIVAALALSGCSNHDESKPAPSSAPQTSAAAIAPSDPGAALPAPEALADVLYRLADPAVKGSDKLALVESTTPDDAATMDRFASALRDGGFTPLTVTASDVMWSDREPGDALATVNDRDVQPRQPRWVHLPDGVPPARRRLAAVQGDRRHAAGVRQRPDRGQRGRPEPGRPAARESQSGATHSDTDALNVDRLARVRHPARRRPLAEGEALGGAADRRRTAAPVQRLGG